MMDAHLERLNRIYPSGKYVLIPKYEPTKWEGRDYDSKLDYKAAINRWKTNPLSYEDAQNAAADGFRIGWIVPSGYVIVDIDNEDDPLTQEYIEKLLHKFEVKYSYNYTHRGIHILLQDPVQKIKSNASMKCGLNIVIDTRANETGYIVLPTNDPHRKWGQWYDFVEEIPYFLKPILNDLTPTFIGMTEGDGRNTALFKWRTKLEQSHKLTEKEIEKCVRIINENLFETPMPNNELFKTVLRQKDKAEKLSPADKENYYNKTAEELVEKFDIISFGDKFYKFNGTYYKLLSLIEVEQLIHYEISKNITQAGRKEIMQFLRLKTQVKVEDFNKEWYKIAVKNGVVNLITGELTIPTKADYNTIFLPYAYNEDPPYSPRIDQFMKDLANGDPIKMTFLYQIAGYTLLKKNLFSKFFIFKGEGGTGKSTFTNLIRKMLGDDNCSHIALSDFDKDYHLATIVGKLANVDDDVVDGKVLEYTGKFKSIISGEKISVRQIYERVLDFIPYATCMFSCNRLPRIMDKTSGLYRRIVLIELNHKVKKPDLLFTEKITDTDMEYFLFKAVEGIKLALSQGRFAINQSEERLLQLFKRRQSALHEWLYDNDIRLRDVHNVRCMALFNVFVGWCDANRYTRIMTMFTFREDMCALYDVEVDFVKQDGKVVPVQTFIRRGDFDPEFKPF